MPFNQPVSQLHILRNDKWLLSMLTWIPVLLALSIWWIFSQGSARDINFAVVDLENSQLSQELIRAFDATASLNVIAAYPSTSEAKAALVNGDIYGYAVIPRNYGRDIALRALPKVTVFYNSQYILIGKAINSAVQQAHGTFSAKLGVAQQLAKGSATIDSAASKTVNIRNHIVPLFNKNSNYAQFLVGAVVPALWQIFIIVTTILVLTANHRIYGLKLMLGSTPLRKLSAIMSFYIPIYIIMGIGLIVWFYLLLNWPMQGSVLAIMFAQILTIVACIAMACLFFFLTLDPARAMSFAGAFTAPSFAFMGVTFPVSDMSSLATFWRSLLPISHYIEAQIGQSSYGVTISSSVVQSCINFSGYLIPMGLVYLLCKKHLANQERAA
jgi:ABC-2 type transport system permease protein